MMMMLMRKDGKDDDDADKEVGEMTHSTRADLF